MANGRRVPFSSSVIVNQAEALEWIDQLRVTIPEEVKSARRVNNEVERLLEQAREEAEQILARAQEQATYLIEERELTRQAEELSHEIVRQAETEGAAIRRGADDYASEVLVGLETEVMRTLKTINAAWSYWRIGVPSKWNRPPTKARKKSQASTTKQARSSLSAAEALTFHVAGLLAEPLGTIRNLHVSAPPLDLGPDLEQTKGVDGRGPAHPDEPRSARSRAALQRHRIKSAAAACAISIGPWRSRSTRRHCRPSTSRAVSRWTRKPNPTPSG